MTDINIQLFNTEMISKIVTRRVLSIPLVCKNTYSISNMPTSEIDPGKSIFTQEI